MVEGYYNLTFCLFDLDIYRYFCFCVDTFDIQKYRYVSIDDIPITSLCFYESSYGYFMVHSDAKFEIRTWMFLDPEIGKFELWIWIILDPLGAFRNLDSLFRFEKSIFEDVEVGNGALSWAR